MRLTEAPRPLAEMRPEVAWPAEVQAVLDKALQRDVNGRYRSASEFGRSLFEALGRMVAPERAAARVPDLGAENPTLPVTRVAPGRPAAAPREPGASGSVASTPARRRNRAPAYAVGGLTVAVILVGAAMALNRQGQPRRDSVTPSGPATSDGKVPGSKQYAKGMDSSALASTGLGTTRGIDATLPSAAVTAALDSLERVVSGDVTPNEAARVIRGLEQMKSRIKGNEQVVQAAIVDALAESSRNNNVAACAALRSVLPIAPGTKRARQVERTMSVCD